MKKKKVLFICSVGGHLTQMLQLKRIFDDYNYLLVTEKTDVTKDLSNKYNVKFFKYCCATVIASSLFISTFSFRANILNLISL